MYARFSTHYEVALPSHCRSVQPNSGSIAHPSRPNVEILPAWLSKPCTTARTPELEAVHDIPAKIAPYGPEASLLTKELAVFSVLIYKQTNQHRRTLSFRRIQEVSQCRK